MKNEQALVLELCRYLQPNRKKIEELLEGPIDAALVLGELLYHRMGSVAWHVLKECGLTGRVNREFRNTLHMVYDSNCQKSTGFRRLLTGMADVLEDVNFPYAVLKGARLAYEYPVGLRTSNDLDILVRQQDISSLTERLKAAGYVQGYIRNDHLVPATRSEILNSRLNRGETVPFVRRVDWEQMKFCEVDINFSLDFKAKESSHPVELLLEEREPLEVGEGRTLMTLSRADFLIQLCAHLYKEAVIYQWVEMGRDLSLYKFCDIYLLITKELDAALCGILTDRILSCGVEKECYYALSLTDRLFEVNNPYLPVLLRDIKPADTAYMHEIQDPSGGKRYRYDLDFTDWLFCADRRVRLKETTRGVPGDET
ncbi:MAG: nucleotidyltransferase family protein [Clostridiales bacterium]|nr:nucleotidyltransferase family protein [Clostridiales bacterium]